MDGCGHHPIGLGVIRLDGWSYKVFVGTDGGLAADNILIFGGYWAFEVSLSTGVAKGK